MLLKVRYECMNDQLIDVFKKEKDQIDDMLDVTKYLIQKVNANM